MGYSYSHAIRSAAVRVNAIAGSTSATLETNYLVTPLTTTEVDSADFPLSVFKDTALLVEQRLAHAIANVGNHPWRKFLAGSAPTVAHETALPSVDGDAKNIIGVWGSVYDATDGTVCTEKPLEVIRRLVDNPGTFWKCNYYYYKMDGGRIYHTRTNVKIDCCVYNWSDRISAIATLTSATLLPEVLEEAHVCGMVSMLVRDDAFIPQSQIYRNYFEQALAMITQGLTSVPPKAIPAPTMTANAA